MMISIIAAMADNRVIGIDNGLPWRLPADMQWFRKHTLGKPVLMGRSTYESIGRLLPQRVNVIVTRDPGYQLEGALVCNSIEDALVALDDEPELMVIGGANVYGQMLARADRLYLTLIHQAFDGDTWFPDYKNSQWREIERTDCESDQDNPHPYSFVILERIKDSSLTER